MQIWENHNTTSYDTFMKITVLLQSFSILIFQYYTVDIDGNGDLALQDVKIKAYFKKCLYINYRGENNNGLLLQVQ